PVGLGGATNAPLDSNGKNTFMGSKFFPFSQQQGFTLESCTSACTAQTAYNKAHPNKDGSFMTCAFVNGYVLSRNGVPQGLYCSMYNQTWATSYATNYGQYRGSVRYTVSNSYAYSVITRPAIPAGPNCPQDVGQSCGKYALLPASMAAIPSIFTATGSTATCGLDCLANPDCFAWSTNDNQLSYNEADSATLPRCQFYTQSVADIIDEYDYQRWRWNLDDSYATLFDYDCFDTQGNLCGDPQQR
ncbi:hypothetical protein KCU67_g4038, partial [Aureobasidium melanogenum]